MAEDQDQDQEQEQAPTGPESWHRDWGRPTKYTPETVEAILSALRKGDGPTHAAKLAGINYSTLREWATDPAKSDFSEAIKKAQAIGDQANRDECLNTIRKAAAGYKIGDEIVRPTWQAAAWYLERRHRAEFGRFEQVALDATVQETRRELFDQVVGAVDDDTRAALVEIAAGIRRGDDRDGGPVDNDRGSDKGQADA